MGVNDITGFINDDFECEVHKPGDNVKSNIYLVRPCERYKELYSTCSSWVARIQQYYVYGEKLDCNPHYDNYKACMKYRKTKNANLLDPVIKWEENMILVRNKSVELNTVWQLRDKPPKNFSDPLPKH